MWVRPGADLKAPKPAATSAYLTASEIFPLETRALAIACFYALGTAIGGSILLIKSGSAWRVSFGYGIAARADAFRGPY